MPILDPAVLEDFTWRVFQATGAPEASAHLVARSLIEADLAGHESHGVIRIVEYLQAIERGRIVPAAAPEIVRDTAATVIVDGHWGFGQVIAGWAMDRVIEKALAQNVAAATVFHCGHVGRLGVYPLQATERGLIGFACANGGGKEPRVAPFGGARPIFGTNPLAAALPVEGRPPIVLDFSTAIVAAGKIRVARDKGEELPDGWILDRNGRPSCRPQDYYDGGMLLPVAGHKGYALSLFVEAVAGLLSGAGTPILPQSGYQVGNGLFLLALNISAFRPLVPFMAELAELTGKIKAAPPVVAGRAVLLPGEPEEQTRQQRLGGGISVPDKTWQTILDASRKIGVEASTALIESA